MDWQLSKESIMDRIQTLFKTSQWSDCSFKVKGKSDVQIFKAHKLILASSSPVFEAMFFGPLAEKSCITLSDIEPEVFRILLEYIYTDCVKFSAVEEAGGVLYAAKKYMFPHLTRMCCDYLIANLRPSNVLPIFEFANEIGENRLTEACVNVMRIRTGEIFKSPRCHFSAITLKTVLKQTSLNIDEVDLFNVALEWAKEECEHLDWENSTENLRKVLVDAGVLSSIRFLCLSPQEFADGPLHSGILKPNEIYNVQCALEKICNRKASLSFRSSDSFFKNTYTLDLTDFPAGWSKITQPRGRIPINHFFCVRRFLKTAVTVSGHLRLLTNIKVDHSVIVSGVRIFTRLIPASFNFISTSPPQTYKENVSVSVLDQQGTLLCHTLFNDIVEYNTLATVNLNEAVQFGNNKEYSILFTLPYIDEQMNEYPLGFMSQTERTRDIEFRFCDHADIGDTGAFVRRLDMGFLESVIYSV